MSRRPEAGRRFCEWMKSGNLMPSPGTIFMMGAPTSTMSVYAMSTIKKEPKSTSGQPLVATVFVSMLTFFLITYAFHCVWATSEAYSSPSIVLTARTHDGSRIIFDDFRYNQYSTLKFSGIDL